MYTLELICSFNYCFYNLKLYERDASADKAELNYLLWIYTTFLEYLLILLSDLKVAVNISLNYFGVKSAKLFRAILYLRYGFKLLALILSRFLM